VHRSGQFGEKSVVFADTFLYTCKVAAKRRYDGGRRSGRQWPENGPKRRERIRIRKRESCVIELCLGNKSILTNDISYTYASRTLSPS
jgi:hypothetical protein